MRNECGVSVLGVEDLAFHELIHDAVPVVFVTRKVFLLVGDYGNLLSLHQKRIYIECSEGGATFWRSTSRLVCTVGPATFVATNVCFDAKEYWESSTFRVYYPGLIRGVELRATTDGSVTCNGKGMC